MRPFLRVAGITDSPPRFTLNYKGLPYRTVWVEYPDIEGLCKKIGADPTKPPSAAFGQYTLPVLQDPNTGRVISESIKIARYLDAAYPDTPPILPPQLDALTEALDYVFMNSVFGEHLRYILLPAVPTGLNTGGSAEYFRRTRESAFGCKLEDVAPPGSAKREEYWKGGREGLSLIAGWLEADGKEKRWFAGETISHADLILAGFLTWARDTVGPESAEWKEVASWDGGRWGRLVSTVSEQYGAVDEGTLWKA